MANYTKSTNFTAKDALASGNPSKIVLGSEHDAEYTAIATAIATKMDGANTLSAETSVVSADVVPFYDDSAGSHKKITTANLALSLNKILKIETYTLDAGSTTTSGSYTNVSGSVKSFTPLSATSTIGIFVTFNGNSGAVAAQNNTATFQMYETAVGSGIGAEPTLSAPSGGGGVGATAPCSMFHTLASSGTSARTFGLQAKSSHGGNASATSQKWIIFEFAS